MSRKNRREAKAARREIRQWEDQHVPPRPAVPLEDMPPDPVGETCDACGDSVSVDSGIDPLYWLAVPRDVKPAPASMYARAKVPPGSRLDIIPEVVTACRSQVCSDVLESKYRRPTLPEMRAGLNFQRACARRDGYSEQSMLGVRLYELLIQPYLHPDGQS